MTKAEKKAWIKTLKHYWKLREEMYSAFCKNERGIEDMMKKELGEELEFFYGDMHEGCLGIGHADLDRRSSKKRGYFPLFHYHDLE